MYRVFLGAPPKEIPDTDNISYSWQTLSSKASSLSASGVIPDDGSVTLPAATLEAASTRISILYQNVIFHDDSHDDITASNPSNNTTVFMWPPTLAEGEPSIDPFSQSIARFPSFQFNPNVLCSLAQLTKAPKRVSMLLAVLEVDGPDVVKIKTGPDAGREVGVLKMILGEEGGVGKLTAWREIAERWGGVSGEGAAVKRGDVVLIENVNGLRDAATAPSLTASPYLNSKLTICYRTMPYTKEDQALRPDLRLGASDAAVRKVGGVVRWFEKMAGLA
ncbi:hypothetical protein AMATHDRAFT_76413 [Amanita thiersii Skay4041]|uniref:Uncharacterized protein n=1 Tax=Amanita thiersii Skay4041 TaxID=703135 RepID=A0A2A9NMZ2_9AGAR|nr:hypothetical protein AMATHDRAFT_76413 [Amanita thiersii Skay4041]